LAEKVHAGGIEAEAFIFRKKALGGRVVLMAGHDEPVKRPPVALARGEQFSGKNLEERFAQDRRNRKGAFGAIVAKPGPLPACHREGRHAAGAQCRLTRDLGLLPCRGIPAMGHQRLVGCGRKSVQIDPAAALPPTTRLR